MTTRRRAKAWAALSALGALAALLPVQASTAQHAGSLQITPEISTKPAGEAIELTATLSESVSSGEPAVNIDFEVEFGPDDDGNTPTSPDATCSVTNGTTCPAPVQLSSDEQTTALVRAWIDHDGNDATVEADAAEFRLAGGGLLGTECGLIEPDCQRSGEAINSGDPTRPEPDDTDVVEVTWTGYAEGLVDCDDTDQRDGSEVEYQLPDQRQVSIVCQVMSRFTGRPIPNALIDAEIMGGPFDSEPTGGPDVADLPNRCTTDGNGVCGFSLAIPGSGPGSALVCFWLDGNNSDDFSTAVGADGGECDNEQQFDEQPDLNDIADSLLIDIDNPRASGLEAGPEVQNAPRGSRFQLVALVYDQFGFSFTGADVRGELFGGSPLDQDGNTPETPDLTFTCPPGQQHCSVWTAAQPNLGTNLACIWIHPAQAPAPARMIGDAFNGGTCEDEIPTDPGGEDGRPAPVNDGRDIVRFTIQSRPVIASAAPSEKRQETSDVLKIAGADFLPTARISVSGVGVKLGETRRLSAAQLEATIDVAPDAPPGPRDVTVTNLSDGGTTTCGGCFKVIGQGYWLVASDGGIFSFGDARFHGSTGDRPLNKPIVAMAPTPSGQGYWLVASDGGIFAQGDAPFVGSAGSVPLNQPIVAIAAHPSGRGYWLVASDGGIFTYGDARFYGSTGRLPLNRPIVAIAASPSGKGYWLVASDGGIFAFGDARFHGSTGAIALNKPIVAMAATKTGKGYWLVASDGGIFAFGDARFHGSTGAIALNKPIVGMTTTPLANGYWLVASDGGIFAFGDARFHGSTGAITLNRPIVGMARR